MDDRDITLELLQYEAIGKIFRKVVKSELAVKGGFAMRLGYGSKRRTKDIDLQQNNKFPSSRLVSVIEPSLHEAARIVGIQDLKITMPKKTETVHRWKLNGSTPRGSHIHLTVEVSRRDIPIESLTSVRHGDAEIDIYDKNAMAASKTLAFVGAAHRIAIRDIWDLDVLIQLHAEPPFDMIASVCTPEAVALMWDKLTMMDWDTTKKELLPFLEESVASQISRQTYEDMLLRVGMTMQGWLESGMLNHEEMASETMNKNNSRTGQSLEMAATRT